MAMKTTYVQRGESLDYQNATSSPIEAGDIITLGTRIGIAGCDIPAGETGSVEVTGVFLIPKKTATDVIAQGDALYYSSGATKDNSGGIVIGYAAAASAKDEKTVAAKLLG